MCIYTTAGYTELFLYGVLILSRNMSALCLLEILFHSPFFLFHRPYSNVVFVTATNKLTVSLTVIRYRSLNAAEESHETEHDFRLTVSADHITWLIPVALFLQVFRKTLYCPKSKNFELKIVSLPGGHYSVLSRRYDPVSLISVLLLSVIL